MTDTATRVRIVVRGAVQGVGFRPFVHRRATALGLAGWVSNSAAGVIVEAEGEAHRVETLLADLRASPPPNACVIGVETHEIAPLAEAGFVIRPSETEGARVAQVLPDLATCDDCLRELRDPADRRFRYPFINCTQCGPRYSIIEAVPYDRVRTSMRGFRMCPACQAEYDDPVDRRFHAEPNACPACGPRLALWDGAGQVLAADHAAIIAAAAAVRAGRIVAAKGIGGFHLIADARNEAAIRRLRQRKRREEKPLAVVFSGLAAAAECCRISSEEAALLTGPVRPIVLLRRMGGGIAAAVAPGNPWLGVMLPYAPLHHLLLDELGFPVVATSGNVSDEPIVTDAAEALATLAGIADVFLVHDRPIVRAVDDSVVRVVCGRAQVLRRARGLAPGRIDVGGVAAGILAVGGHLKTTVALTQDDGVVLSQHIGDLETGKARQAHVRAIADLTTLHATSPRLAVRDRHPDYASGRAADALGLPVVEVQHHLAHVIACMAEHGVRPPALGVAWDGTGFGTDGTIWGGEFLLVTPDGWHRVAHLRPFRLPGGEAAAREPRRAALGLLHAAFGDAVFAASDLPPIAAFTPAELGVLREMLDRGTNAPWTTSAGRLFDAFASVTGLRQRASYEGQAAAEFEWAAEGLDCSDSPLPLREGDRGRGGYSRQSSAVPTPPPIPLPQGEGGALGTSQAVPRVLPLRVRDQHHPAPPLIIDWQPALEAALTDVRAGVPAGVISAALHAGLAAAIAEIARRIGERCVVLSGGCFQNARLTEATVTALRTAGCDPLWHQRVPPNDGGLALGQAVWAAWQEHEGDARCASPFPDGS